MSRQRGGQIWALALGTLLDEDMLTHLTARFTSPQAEGTELLRTGAAEMLDALALAEAPAQGEAAQPPATPSLFNRMTFGVETSQLDTLAEDAQRSVLNHLITVHPATAGAAEAHPRPGHPADEAARAYLRRLSCIGVGGEQRLLDHAVAALSERADLGHPPRAGSTRWTGAAAGCPRGARCRIGCTSRRSSWAPFQDSPGRPSRPGGRHRSRHWGGMMRGMDQGDAAVWAAALGIAGTLAGALGGAIVQGRLIRRQVQDQEAVDVRHRLREERQAAFVAVLDRCSEAEATFSSIIVARVQPGWDDDADHRELWAPTNAALEALRRAVTAVAITGPDSMADLASAIHEAVQAKANAMRLPAADFAQRVRMFGEHSTVLEQAQRNFIRQARAVLAAPAR
ncbi:hypothetical protein [Streptomyces sp. NPDC051452]|uniref:hypothetical protein n=1 Tax=Streptomyces sp. NPDC051452 TaxID=3365654 RepID=UPI00379E081E